jgi:hypothetical protein
MNGLKAELGPGTICIDMQRLFHAKGRGRRHGWRAFSPFGDTAGRTLPGPYTDFTRFLAPAAAEGMSGTWRAYYHKWAEVTRARIDPSMLGLMPELQRYAPRAVLFDKVLLTRLIRMAHERRSSNPPRLPPPSPRNREIPPLVAALPDEFWATRPRTRPLVGGKGCWGRPWIYPGRGAGRLGLWVVRSRRGGLPGLGSNCGTGPERPAPVQGSCVRQRPHRRKRRSQKCDRGGHGC